MSEYTLAQLIHIQSWYPLPEMIPIIKLIMDTSEVEITEINWIYEPKQIMVSTVPNSALKGETFVVDSIHISFK